MERRVARVHRDKTVPHLNPGTFTVAALAAAARGADLAVLPERWMTQPEETSWPSS